MKIETYIDALTSYAIKTGLADPEERHVLINRLLDLLGKADYESSGGPQPETLEDILAGVLQYAVANDLCDNNITARDIVDTRIMGTLTPCPAK